MAGTHTDIRSTEGYVTVWDTLSGRLMLRRDEFDRIEQLVLSESVMVKERHFESFKGLYGETVVADVTKFSTIIDVPPEAFTNGIIAGDDDA